MCDKKDKQLWEEICIFKPTGYLFSWLGIIYRYVNIIMGRCGWLASKKNLGDVVYQIQKKGVYKNLWK